MSLILEALRKSETERRLGQAPGLMSPMPIERRRKRSHVLIASAGLMMSLLLGVSLWWLTRDQRKSTSATATPEASIEASDPSSGAASNTSTSATISTPEPSPRRPSEKTMTAVPATPNPTPKPSPRSESEPDVSPIPTPRDPAFESVERESVPVPAQATPQPAPVIALTAPAVAVPTLPSLAAPVEAPASSDAVAQDDLPRLDQLPSAERDALPPLKLSMHVYTESPANRFVLIDGHRYGEGEKLAASLQLVEIQRHGIVLDLNGRRFLLQRP